MSDSIPATHDDDILKIVDMYSDTALQIQNKMGMFEPRNRPDLDVAQTGDDVTLHGGGKFVPRGSSDPRDEVSERAIPEPRVKPGTYRMLPYWSIPVPAARPDQLRAR